jgi:hypothetical protein
MTGENPTAMPFVSLALNTACNLENSIPSIFLDRFPTLSLFVGYRYSRTRVRRAAAQGTTARSRGTRTDSTRRTNNSRLGELTSTRHEEGCECRNVRTITEPWRFVGKSPFNCCKQRLSRVCIRCRRRAGSIGGRLNRSDDGRPCRLFRLSLPSPRPLVYPPVKGGAALSLFPFRPITRAKIRTRLLGGGRAGAGASI